MTLQLLGIDIGTSSVKSVVIDTGGRVVTQASRQNQLSSLHPGWAEEDPNQWWDNTIVVIRDCLDHADVSPGSIGGIGVTGMVPAIVLLDGEGRPVRPSIQQNDARTAEEITEFSTKFDPDQFFSVTGSSLSQQSVGPKLVWLQRYEPETWSRVERVMGSYDFINHCLTGEESLEANWALESGLFDISSADWSDQLLSLFGVDRSIFPPIRQPVDIIGGLSIEAAQAVGLQEGIPVIAGSADHVAAALAAGVRDEGDLLLKFGSSGDILYSCDRLVLDPRLFIDYHDIPGKYLLNGCMATSGSLLRWFVEGFCQADQEDARNAGVDIYDHLNTKAEEIPAGCDGLVVLPYFLGEKTPVLDPSARGVFFGMTLFHSRYHLYRAILEAVVFGFKHHVRVLEDRGLPVSRVLVSEGGARSPLWRQITADALNQPVIYLKENPGAALAAAFITGIAVNGFTSWAEIDRFIEVESVTQPNPETYPVYERNFETYLEIYRSLKNTFQGEK